MCFGTRHEVLLLSTVCFELCAFTVLQRTRWIQAWRSFCWCVNDWSWTGSRRNASTNCSWNIRRHFGCPNLFCVVVHDLDMLWTEENRNKERRLFPRGETSRDQLYFNASHFSASTGKATTCGLDWVDCIARQTIRSREIELRTHLWQFTHQTQGNTLNYCGHKRNTIINRIGDVFYCQ